MSPDAPDPVPARWARLAEAVRIEKGVDQALAEVDPRPLLTPPPRRAVPRTVKIRIYRRDSFTCRYCGRETIFEPVFAVLGVLYPDQAPFQLNWRAGACHPDVRTHATTLDHFIPKRDGGTDADDNLLTACPQCNYTKADFPYAGEPRPPAGTDWDGLSSLYPDLCLRAGLQGSGTHRDWLHALR